MLLALLTIKPAVAVDGLLWLSTVLGISFFLSFFCITISLLGMVLDRLSARINSLKNLGLQQCTPASCQVQ